MRSTNRIFYATKAVFDESTFLHCPEGSRASIPAIETGVLPIDEQNIPLEEVDFNNQAPPPPPVERDNVWRPRNPIPFVPRDGDNGNQLPPYNIPLPDSRTETRSSFRGCSQPSSNMDDIDTPAIQPRHPLNWVPVPQGIDNLLQLRWIPADLHIIPTSQSEMHGDLRRFINRWSYWQTPAQVEQPPNVPVRTPSPENIAGLSNIQPAQQGPRRTGRVRQPRQQPDSVYGSDLVQTESLTDAA